MPFDPIEHSAKIEQVVMSGDKRRYNRFRAAPYYGGIATADALGCNLLCAYCWNYFRNLHPDRSGRFYSPKEVAGNLLRIAQKKGFHLYRMTGSEPVLGERSLQHLLEIIKLVSQGDSAARFILETNGLILGYHPEFCERLPKEGLMVRVAIKGADEESFEKITGAKGEFLVYQIKCLKFLEEAGIESWPAFMGDLFSGPEIKKLKNRLKSEGITAELEIERLERYPYVMEQLRKRKIEIKGF
jgi:uncharacterized Fe-S cluster-containing radical SAM superfamily protein